MVYSLGWRQNRTLSLLSDHLGLTDKQLVPDVLASNLETKNRVLSEGIYDYFDQR